MIQYPRHKAENSKVHRTNNGGHFTINRDVGNFFTLESPLRKRPVYRS